jgi:hypothetical protein
MPQHISAEPLAQMVRSITLQKRTGVLQVEQLGGRGAERGEMYFENGSLTRVRTEHEIGKAALQRIGEWKQITCAFHSISRPPRSATMPLTSKPQGEASHISPQTDPLARTPPISRTEARRYSSASAGERTTRAFEPSQSEEASSLEMRTALLPTSQPLVLHGTRLETYTPVPQAVPSRSVQRWTTHQISPLEVTPLARKVSSPPQFIPVSEAEKKSLREEKLPGRQAVFKARQTTTSPAQAIQQMERHARLIFILLDGQRTIQDIAHLIHRSEAEVERVLVDLTRRGYTTYISG